MTGKPLTILGIETSCDETAAAVVRGLAPGPGEILSNMVFSQTEAHAPYGGVVPEIASRAHLEILDDIIQRALDEAGLEVGELDGVAATAGPGRKPAHHRGRSFIAAGLDTQNGEGLARHGRLLYAEKPVPQSR